MTAIFCVVLWLAFVATFLYFVDGRSVRRVVLYFLGVIGLVALVIAGGLIQEALASGGYADVLQTMSRAGSWILIGALVFFLGDMCAMAVYTIRNGHSDGAAGKVVTANQPLTMSLGQTPPMGRSKRKILFTKNRFITMKSLVDGTASAADRLMFVGIHCAIGSFFLIWVGLALIGIRTNVLAIAILIVPGLWAGNIAHDTWTSYRRVKGGLPEDED